MREAEQHRYSCNNTSPCRCRQQQLHAVCSKPAQNGCIGVCPHCGRHPGQK
jgi:hypothetical protein